MKYLQIIIITCTLMLMVAISLQAQEQKKARLYTGYQFSMVDYIQIGLDSRYLFAEGRLSVNNYIADQHDAEIAAGINFYHNEDARFYVNLNANTDFNNIDVGVGLGLGGIVFPFSHQNIGLQFEAGPQLGDIGNLDINVRGAAGITYYFGNRNAPRHNVEKEPLVYNPKSGIYFSALGTTLTGGIIYARYFGNLQIHAGLALGVPTGGTAGFYYHFIDRERSPHWHMYAGADISAGTIDDLIILPYLPIGIQYLSANGFTFSFDAGPLYTPDEELSPWAGIKIGKTFFH